MGDEEQRRETGNSGRATRNRDVRGNRRQETINREVRHGTENWRQGTKK
jgi:hypothetical protein